MKILKYLLFGLGGIILLLVIISLFLSSKPHFERSITINAPADSVFKQVNSLKNWSKWDPWMAKDPNAVSTYEGPEAGIGSIHRWDSKVKEVGTGSMTITGSVPNQAVDILLDFGKNGTATGGFKFKPEGNGVNVTWGFDMDAGMNPMKRIMGAMMDKMIGPEFDKGLANLKTVSESAPKVN
jgi:hypothetical protein